MGTMANCTERATTDDHPLHGNRVRPHGLPVMHSCWCAGVSCCTAVVCRVGTRTRISVTRYDWVCHVRTQQLCPEGGGSVAHRSYGGVMFGMWLVISYDFVKKK